MQDGVKTAQNGAKTVQDGTRRPKMMFIRPKAVERLAIVLVVFDLFYKVSRSPGDPKLCFRRWANAASERSERSERSDQDEPRRVEGKRCRGGLTA